MTSLPDLIQQGNSLWFFLPTAFLLGALHGLEPGHSKTVMAAFIVSVRGTVPQAMLLGLSATFSHTLIVWLLAGVGLFYGRNGYSEKNEPYFQLASAVLILVIAVWMLWRTHRERRLVVYTPLENQDSHGSHSHPLSPGLTEHHSHHEGLDLGDSHFHDTHQRAHVEEIRQRFTNRKVTTGQIVLFGLTGGLIPCPSAITVLLLCFQIKRVALGFFLVLGFSLGLAVTMVASGVVAALSVKHLTKRFSRISNLFQFAPYLASLFIVCLGLFMGVQAWVRIQV